MNRVISFKGKRANAEDWEQQWVEGLYYNKATGHCGYQIVSVIACIREFNVSDFGGAGWTERRTIEYEVTPASVCEYSGCKDKNLELIYEGDIVAITNGNKSRYVCVFKDGKFILTNGKDSIPLRQNQLDSLGADIIGNVYDSNDEDIIELYNKLTNGTEEEKKCKNY